MPPAFQEESERRRHARAQATAASGGRARSREHRVYQPGPHLGAQRVGAGTERSAAGAEEGEAPVGMAGQRPSPFVDQAVMVAAERHQVVEIGGPAVGPVDQMVQVHPSGSLAAGEAAALVAMATRRASHSGSRARPGRCPPWTRRGAPQPSPGEHRRRGVGPPARRERDRPRSRRAPLRPPTRRRPHGPPAWAGPGRWPPGGTRPVRPGHRRSGPGPGRTSRSQDGARLRRRSFRGRGPPPPPARRAGSRSPAIAPRAARTTSARSGSPHRWGRRVPCADALARSSWAAEAPSASARTAASFPASATSAAARTWSHESLPSS